MTAPAPLGPAVAVLAYTVVLFTPQLLNDGDTYWHLATGAWVLRHGTVPTVDPFSYTVLGAPWHAHEWLADLAMQLAFALGGWSGVVILFGVALALALGLLTRHLSRWLRLVPTLVTVAVAACCISPSLLARPHLLTLPLLELWTAWLLIGRERGRAPWAVLPLMPAWANMHGSFMLGLALLAGFTLERALAAGAQERRMAGQWLLLLGAAVVSAMATPWGWRGLAFPFQLLGMRALAGIREWQPPDLQALPPIEIALLATLFVCLTRGVRVSVFRTLILIAVLYLALGHARHQMLAGVVGALVLAAPLGRTLGLPESERRSRAVLPAALAVAVIVSGIRLTFPVVRSGAEAGPIAAVAVVPPAMRARPVLNEYGFGGYLIFKGVRPYIDGRTDLYGDAFLHHYDEMVSPDRALLERTIEGRHVQWTIFPPGSPVVPVMDALPGWKRLYADRVAVIHARE